MHLVYQSAKSQDTNKKQQEAVVQEKETLHHEEKKEFDLVDLDVQDEHETSNLVIKVKDAEIRELQDIIWQGHNLSSPSLNKKTNN